MTEEKTPTTSDKQSDDSRSRSRDPLVGTVLDGRFQIEEIIGTGGMSVVYKATQLRVNRHVAIKTLRLQLDTKEIYRERFQREISSLCALNHPNIVTVYDCIIGDDDQPYIIMDYLRGRSLEALIEDEGPMNIERFARISIQICSALEHAHKKGIIHRDLKPGNVVLMDDEMDFVKVVDFGLAKIGDQNRRLTHSGELWGSPPYMSPEQCMGEPQDQRSDLYAVGAVMYEMLTGFDPYRNATTVFEFIKYHTSVPPPAMSVANSKVQVPHRLEAVVLKALEKDPAKRYQSAKEMQEAIVEASAASVGREKGESLFHLANQASKKMPSGGQVDSSAGEAVTPSMAFNRALNPFSESMAAGESAAGSSADNLNAPLASTRADFGATNSDPYTPSVQRWRQPGPAEDVMTPLSEVIKPAGEIVQPAGEVVPPAGEVVPIKGVPRGEQVVKGPPSPSAIPPSLSGSKIPKYEPADLAEPDPPRRPTTSRMSHQPKGNAPKFSRATLTNVATGPGSPLLLVLLLICVAFLVYVSLPGLFGQGRNKYTPPPAVERVTVPPGESDTDKGLSAGPDHRVLSGSENGSVPAKKDTARGEQPNSGKGHVKHHSGIHSQTASRAPHNASSPVSAAPPAAHGAPAAPSKMDQWSTLQNMRTGGK